MGERRSGTRERIQAVAVELFAEHGYEKTSLREIAERLDVTKAALYYHFNTKEAIVVSLFEDLIAGIDEIITWAEAQPRTLETREEILRRYARLARARPKGMMRFIQESKTTMQELAPGENLQCRFRTLSGLLRDPDASLTEQLKSSLALITASASVFMLKDTDSTDEERYDAGLEVALQLVAGTPVHS
ncbi:TetR/AcrR family transcriptional regulator [Actinomadura sp. DC4]|uniref:TetR/AcrR family transcriptional regulator n=1 Tax=Actinomadura sp. DC4 TaxID=3055069 RepID=UPI0025B27DEE|nr:TetR/AcrR family transcriptional regulator [Actinomadura sp. DC4]MDN3353275.1 TetR/AcrR family transcriptional regulator [Actinomadura sp. DC4]